MEKQLVGDTITEIINKYRTNGYVIDFNLKENCIVCNGNSKYDAEQLEIVNVYRYEGDTDPADETVVYAIESKSGLIKGILVNGYGTSSDSQVSKTLEKLNYRAR